MCNKTYSLVAWDYFNSLLKQSLGITFNRVDDFLKPETTLYRWDEIKESEIFDYLNKLNCFEGNLFIVTDASYQKDLGIFQVEAENLKTFIESHYRNFGEPFLDTDIIIVSFEHKSVWVIHHEGIYAHVEFD